MSSEESDNEDPNNKSSVSLRRQFSCYSLKTLIDGGDGLHKEIKTKITDLVSDCRDKFVKKGASELIWESQHDMSKSENSLEYLCTDILKESFTNNVTPVSSQNFFGTEGDTLNYRKENEPTPLVSDNQPPGSESPSNSPFVEGLKIRKKPSIGRFLGGCCFKKAKGKKKKKDSDSSEDDY